MAFTDRTKISEYDATAANNINLGTAASPAARLGEYGVDLDAEAMRPSDTNGALRELMAHLKAMDAGTNPLTTPNLGEPTADVIGLNTSYSEDGNEAQGSIFWNPDELTANLVQNGTILQLGQEIQINVRNNTGSDIADGSAVMATGTLGASGRITVGLMDASDAANAKMFIGIATETITAGGDGKVTWFGKVRDIDTSGFTQPSILWCDPATPGGLTETQPSAPNAKQAVAYVIYSATAQNGGTIFVRGTPGQLLSECHDVEITGTPADNELLAYDTTTGAFINQTAAEAGVLTEVTANDVNSGAATDGYVLTANGSGGAAWEVAASGGLSDGSTLTTGFTFNDNAIAKFGTGGTDLQLKSDGSDIQATLGSGVNFYLNAPTTGYFYAAKAGSTGADVSVPARILNSYNSTAANGGGVGLRLSSPNGSGNVKNAAAIYARYNDVTDGAEDTEVEIHGYTDGTQGEMATIRGDLQSSFPSGITTSSEGNSSQWKAAYDWGNHADAGYVGDSAIGAVGGVQAYDAGLTDIAGLTPTDGNIIVGNGTSWVAESSADARTSLGLGSMATQADGTVDINGGNIDNTAIGATTPAAGSFSSFTCETSLGITAALTSNILDIEAPSDQQYAPQIRLINTYDSAIAPFWNTRKLRGTAAASSGDALGTFAFQSYDTGGTARNAALLQASSEGAGATSHAGNFKFTTVNTSGSGSERMRLNASGQLLIGTTSPSGSEKLRVNGDVYVDGSITEVSDERLKTNVETLPASSEIVKSLRPVTFNWIDPEKNQETQVGFIAQELQEALSDTEYANGVVVQGGSYMGVNYTALVPVLTKALQEAEARITALEETIKELKA